MDTDSKTEEEPFIYLFVCISALALPLLLIPIEKYLNYPHIIEEIVKTLIIFLLIFKLKNTKSQILLAIIFAGLFAISESMFYLAGNIIPSGTLITFGQRLLLTISLHVITTLIILLPALKNKNLIFLGLFLAILVHYLYNLWI